MSESGELFAQAFAKENISVSELQLSQFERYFELLIAWNEKINLTAITAPADVAVKHFVDSLLAFKMLPEDYLKSKTLIDVGTGAGFPGIPLKIMCADLKLTLFDSLQKRLNFLDIVTNELKLSAVRTCHGRAEDGGRDKTMREKYDVATARAVAKMPVLLEYTLPFVKTGGYFLALKGPELDDELAVSEHALKVLGGEVQDVCHSSLVDDYTRNIALI